MWAPGLVILGILAVLLTHILFDMSPLESILALLLSYMLSLVAIQATGATGTLLFFVIADPRIARLRNSEIEHY